MFFEAFENLDFYWGGEEFELNDHLDNAELTAQAKALSAADGDRHLRLYPPGRLRVL